MTTLTTIGWREWIALPDLGGVLVRAKTDTGARTSALHARRLRLERDGDGQLHAGFQLRCEATGTMHSLRVPVRDIRQVTSSNGAVQERPTIRTRLTLGQRSWMANVTLTNRSAMSFAMLLGRTAMSGRFLVDPHASYLQGRP